MADNKKYYYLKLKDNFFDTDAMIVLESMPDGYLYSNILLKLYLRSVKNEGKLMFNERIPYNPTILAQVTRHNVGVVEKALQLFRDLDLIEILDNGAIYMLDIQDYIGQSNTEADRKRKYRAKIKQEKDNKTLKLGQSVGQMSGLSSDKHPPETEKEIETEKETEIQQQIEKKLKQIGIDDKGIEYLSNLIKSRGQSVSVVVNEKLKIIESMNYKNKAGALITAIKEDWKAPSSKNSNFDNFEGRGTEYYANDDLENMLRI